MPDRLQTLQTALADLKAGRYDSCAALCRPLVAAEPRDTDARFFLGVSLAVQGELDEAIDHLTLVLAIQPDHKDARQELARMLQARGLALVDKGQMDPAIADFAHAAAADPANAATHANLAHALATVGRFDESLAATTDALRQAPGDLAIQINHAVALLKSGRLLEGWAANEWRHKKPGREKLPPALMLPRLSSLGRVAGKTIVIYHEEGFGDTIQFLRYAQMLAEDGAHIVFWTPDELARLIRGQSGIAEVLTGDVNLPKFDYHCPIISLPYVFGTSLKRFRHRSPMSKRTRHWRRIGRSACRRGAGSVWYGPVSRDPTIRRRRRSTGGAASRSRRWRRLSRYRD